MSTFNVLRDLANNSNVDLRRAIDAYVQARSDLITENEENDKMIRAFAVIADADSATVRRGQELELLATQALSNVEPATEL